MARSGFRRPTLHPRSRAHGPECGPIQPAPYPHSGHPRVFASGRPDLVEIIINAGVGRIARIGQVPEDRVLRAGEVIPLRRHARAVDPPVTRLHADRHPIGDGLALLNDVRGLGGDGGGEGRLPSRLVAAQRDHHDGARRYAVHPIRGIRVGDFVNRQAWVFRERGIGPVIIPTTIVVLVGVVRAGDSGVPVVHPDTVGCAPGVTVLFAG